MDSLITVYIVILPLLLLFTVYGIGEAISEKRKRINRVKVGGKVIKIKELPRSVYDWQKENVG